MPPAPPATGADPERFYDSGYRERLAGLVFGLLGGPGFMREGRLVQAIARMHAFCRAGREIRERVLAVLPESFVLTHEAVGRFFRAPGSVPETWDRFRAPAPAEALDPADLPIRG